jgi:PEP-CTERM motif
MELMPQPNAEPFWQLAQIRYDFAPTPEPATLVLMATAFGVLALRRQRSSQH